MSYTDNSYKIINDYNFTDSVLGIIKQFEYVYNSSCHKNCRKNIRTVYSILLLSQTP